MNGWNPLRGILAFENSPVKEEGPPTAADILGDELGRGGGEIDPATFRALACLVGFARGKGPSAAVSQADELLAMFFGGIPPSNPADSKAIRAA